MENENPEMEAPPSEGGEIVEEHLEKDEQIFENQKDDVPTESSEALPEGEGTVAVEERSEQKGDDVVENLSEGAVTTFGENISFNEVEAEIEELEEEIVLSRSEGSEDLGRPMFASMVQRDFTIEDPSFLDDFDSTVVEVLEKEEEAEEAAEESVAEEESVSDEDRYAVYDMPSPVTTDIYDQICERLTIISTDSLLSDVPSRIEKEMEVWKCPSGMRGNEMAYLKSTASPNVVRALAEVALYQPARPVEYLAHCLNGAGKSREELGMDPDPRVIQELVEAHERALEAARKRRRSGVASAESSPPDVPSCGSSKASGLDVVRQKYRTDMENLETAKVSREARIRQGGMQYKTTECLGPTTLVKGYLPADVFPERRPTK